MFARSRDRGHISIYQGIKGEPIYEKQDESEPDRQFVFLPR